MLLAAMTRRITPHATAPASLDCRVCLLSRHYQHNKDPEVPRWLVHAWYCWYRRATRSNRRIRVTLVMDLALANAAFGGLRLNAGRLTSSTLVPEGEYDNFVDHTTQGYCM